MRRSISRGRGEVVREDKESSPYPFLHDVDLPVDPGVDVFFEFLTPVVSLIPMALRSDHKARMPGSSSDRISVTEYWWDRKLLMWFQR
jgi:hypothetical protein